MQVREECLQDIVATSKFPFPSAFSFDADDSVNVTKQAPPFRAPNVTYHGFAPSAGGLNFRGCFLRKMLRVKSAFSLDSDVAGADYGSEMGFGEVPAVGISPKLVAEPASKWKLWQLRHSALASFLSPDFWRGSVLPGCWEG